MTAPRARGGQSLITFKDFLPNLGGSAAEIFQCCKVCLLGASVPGIVCYNGVYALISGDAR